MSEGAAWRAGRGGRCGVPGWPGGAEGRCCVVGGGPSWSWAKAGVPAGGSAEGASKASPVSAERIQNVFAKA